MRITITIDDYIYSWLRGLQGRLISETKEDWSFTTVVNMVLVAGIAAPMFIDPKKEEEFWDIIHSFVKDKKITLETEAIVDKVIEELILKKK
ncbi:hypothetical protein DRO69_00190 [Candidatus Bathyarchaeota archaeon]|nr:MAG: hypothetical protein DRO69_00190 [Candidatus Bathyarchaeota archaeon]